MYPWSRKTFFHCPPWALWQVIASAIYFLAVGPTNWGGETAVLMILLGALIAATALLVRHCVGGHNHGYWHF